MRWDNVVYIHLAFVCVGVGQCHHATFNKLMMSETMCPIILNTIYYFYIYAHAPLSHAL